MKQSNKLLIITALTLIIIPLSIMIYIAKANYVTVQKTNYIEEQTQNAADLQSNSADKITTKFNKSFKIVSLDANGSNLHININEDKNYGIKIPKVFKDYISFEVKDGNLNIVFADNFQINDYNHKFTIVVYGPDINTVKVKDAESLGVIAVTDILDIQAKDCEQVNLYNSAITTRNEKQEIINNINQTNIKKLSLLLDESNAEISGLSFQNLSIDLKNNSSIKINKGVNSEIHNNINSLMLNSTEGANAIDIGNIQIKNCLGSLSDSTQIQMPIVNLKQLLK